MNAQSLKNDWLASQLRPVAYSAAVKDPRSVSIDTSDTAMADRIRQTFYVESAEDSSLGLNWDEAIALVTTDKLASIVPTFIYGLLTGNISLDRLAVGTLVWRIQKSELHFDQDKLKETERAILACSFAWLTLSATFFDEEREAFISIARELTV